MLCALAEATAVSKRVFKAALLMFFFVCNVMSPQGMLVLYNNLKAKQLCLLTFATPAVLNIMHPIYQGVSFILFVPCISCLGHDFDICMMIRPDSSIAFLRTPVS